jgi:hypothetical protein
LPGLFTGTFYPSGTINLSTARATNSSPAHNTSASDTPRRSSSPSGTVTSWSTPASILIAIGA